MRSISVYNEKPEALKITVLGKRAAVLIREDIHETTATEEDGSERVEYECVEYSAEVNATVADKIDDDFVKAVIAKEKECAAQNIRAKRNALLDASDAQVLPDRNKSTSAAYKEWAEYRQELRDITKQEGFPFDVEWPEKPE